MEKLAKRLASKIAVTLQYDAEQEAVVAYGLIAMIQTFLTMLAIVLLGYFTNALGEALLLCFAAVLLRKYSGGAHVSSAELCSAFSAIYCLIGAVLSVTVLRQVYNFVGMGICILLFYPVAFYLVYCLVPVDAPNKPIRSERKRARMRKGSFLILTMSALLSVGLLVCGIYVERCRTLGISFLLGLGWQIFSLTGPGKCFVNMVDNIFTKKREEVR